MNKYLIAGNWKMNTDIDSAITLTKNIVKENVQNNSVKIVLGVPYISIYEVFKELKDTNISVSAQNCNSEEKGAYTGEISIPMLKSVGVEYVILGHSERRNYFNETDAIINKKVKLALKNNIAPIICVGESLKDRENNNYKDIVKAQIQNALEGVESIENIVIAYEPIWAIGTGKTATSSQAEEMCCFIREILKRMYEKNAENTFIIYGGSMNKNNAKELLEQKNINGGLIGGASLKYQDFCDIIKCC